MTLIASGTVQINDLAEFIVRQELVPVGLHKPDTVEKWQKLLAILAENGLLDAGGKLPDLVHAGAVLQGLAMGGCDAGVPLTLTVTYVMGFKVLAKLAPELLKDVAAGRGLACMGASEPKIGSHPGKITTTAKRDGDKWILNGLKVFTTGGPVGTVFLVMCVCGESPEGRDLGVFAIPRDTPGFTVSEMPKHPGLECAPHGVLKLENVTLPASSRLGPSGPKQNGWTEIVKPFRQWEDALMASWISGLLWRSTLELKELYGRTAGLENTVGRLVASSRAMLTLARDSAQSLVDEEAGAPAAELTARRYGFFEQLRHVAVVVNDLAGKLPPGENPEPLLRIRALLNQLQFAETARGKIVSGLAG